MAVVEINKSKREGYQKKTIYVIVTRKRKSGPRSAGFLGIAV